jgi:hypothetical protein
MHVWRYVFNHQCKSLLDINLNLSFVFFCPSIQLSWGCGRGGEGVASSLVSNISPVKGKKKPTKNMGNPLITKEK